MTRVAAFDCGTNSLRLLVADIDGPGRTSTELVREMRIVRLGQGVDRTGRIAEASMQRVVRRPRRADASSSGPTTSARSGSAPPPRPATPRTARSSSTGSASGSAWSRRSSTATPRPGPASTGATRTLPPLPEPLLVLDIGGGSTELILGTADGTVLEAESLDIGSVRLNERHLADDPPSKEQVQAAVDDIDAALDACSVDPARAGAVIGVAGTVTTVAAAVLGPRLPTTAT